MSAPGHQHTASFIWSICFASNQIHATRQVACHPGDSSTVDMVLSLNGIPLATMELKNPATGQTWKHAVAQYKRDRDSRAPLFQFIKGAVVHFAVDPDEVYMATRLNKDKTFFLPFNRGSAPGEIECGRGNPQHPSGYRTGYFWEEVLARDSFLDIVGNFIFLETREETVHDAAGGRRKVTRVTTLEAPSEPNHLELLKHELNAFQVYLWPEVVGFCHVFYLPQYRQNPSDHARMEKRVAPAADRFKALDEAKKETLYTANLSLEPA